jgi:tetratricopeptide (TPR) repeat protein
MKQILILLLVVITSCAHAQKVYEFNSTCQQAYQEISMLRLNAGLALVDKARQQNPNNLIPLLLESYADFYRLFLNEDPADYRQYYPAFARRIELLKEGPESSPFYGFCLSTVRVQKAAVSVKFGKFWDAGWEFRRAYQDIKQARKDFPTFTPNDLIYGALQAITGTIPKGYKWIAGIFGMKGSLNEGMKMVRGFVNSSDPWAHVFFNEAAFIYPYLMFYLENKKDEAIAFAQQKRMDLENNHLHAYMAANLCINNQQSALAQKIILGRNLSGEYLPTPVWDFELGFTRLYRLEIPQAARHFENFVNNFRGTFYMRDALQKLSWCYYLQGNMAKAEETRKRILQKGATNSDADKQALKDAKTGKWPNMLLLKARLLSDGGFASEAAGLLQGKTEDDFAAEEEKLEFAYRAGRIYDALERDDDAIRNYLIAIRMGEHRKEYFAARAAVQIGYIYEKRGQKALAIQYYQRCLDMDDHEFKDSLDQRAKSGIARCKGE